MSLIIRGENGVNVFFDNAERGSFAPEVRVSDHRLAQGAIVSDHALRMATPFTFLAQVSNKPITAFEGLSVDTDRKRRVREQLEQLVGVVCTVSHPDVGSIENCLIISWPHEIDAFDRFVFEITFKPILFGTERRATLPPERVRPDKRPKHEDPKEDGKSGKSKVNPETGKSRKLKSWLAQARDTDRGENVAKYFGIDKLTAPTQ